MKSNYKKLGPHIRDVIEKNSGNQIDKLLGVSIQKVFITSIANTIGTDMSTYKIVRKNQLAYGPVTSRNGDKISVALLQKSDCIVSTSYTIFEITDQDELLPEYLMMWFRRPEFDRYARFMSHGSVREIFGWEEMCNVELPIPKPEMQKEIVAEYNNIVDRIKLKEQLRQKLEETAQAIYKQWFVDFEFPDEKGEPYKTNNGEMVLFESLGEEIPKNWTFKSIFEVFDVQYGYPFDSNRFTNDFSHNPVIRIRDIKSNTTNTYSDELPDIKYEIHKGDVLVGMDGEFHVSIWGGDLSYQNQRIVRIRKRKDQNICSLQALLALKLPLLRLQDSTEGTTVAHLGDKDLKEFRILVADNNIQFKASKLFSCLINNYLMISKEIILLNRLKYILLQKIAK